ncbi:MAG TPA: bifunctional phosphopantothenoylcysteine decarboxylase/phosphopantothenate--cysteine ligase CoaBC [Methylomirabilota bacterium]|nr:bifunctional phosphopantothenoylcysteine decarboxylase/phosphopantothenate--cysteine ligase CoaBC [Methylomirabilota bacterium]
MGPGQRVLLVITGGIAAYKCLDLIRRLRERGVAVRCILTEAASHFVTPLSVAALSEQEVASDLFSPSDEARMGHIRLARETDLVVVAPATANTLAKMAAGIADDLASTALLATDRPVLVAPAMNTVMWQAPATQANLATLVRRGVHVVGPGAGDLACGEVGPGRMVEPSELLAAIEGLLSLDRRLAGRRVLVTSGPTLEPVDPVRFLGNRSSGKQGHAIAAAAAAAGADTVLVSGPVALPDPAGVRTVRVETAAEMLAACLAELPVDAAVCAAAVADWRAASLATSKLSKTDGGPPVLELVENPDILATLAGSRERRPHLVIGFAAETDDVLERAAAKRRRKGCDWIVANDVSREGGVLGGDDNTVHLVRDSGVESWPRLAKAEVARRLVEAIARSLDEHREG